MSIALWAMLERLVPVSNIVKEMNLVLFGEECCSNTVHRSIAPTFVVEATLPVKEIEELLITFGSPQVQITDFEVAPD